MDWLKQYLDNYEGTSKEAKSLEDTIKTLFNGSKYLPWATMERVTYIQDPLAVFEIVRAKSDYGDVEDILHTSKRTLRTLNKTTEKTVETENSMFAHFVVVRLTFLGKTFEEVYPILGKKYDAPKFIDAHLVNKALQRAKAKVASRATGLGLKLYEGLDLQFDDATPKKEAEKAPVKKAVKASTKKEEPTVVDETPIATVLETKDGVNELVAFITGNENAGIALQKVNASVFKKYKFTLSVDEPVEALVEKLNKITNTGTFLRTLVKFAG